MEQRSSLRTRLVSLASAMAVTVAGLAITVVAAPAAAADISPVAAPGADVVTADALPTVQIDGVVWSQAISGNTVYAGGNFTSARPAGAAAGVNTTPRTNLLSYDLTTGVLNTLFAPVLDGQVQAVAAAPDGSRIYIAGDFTTVNGQPAGKVAALNPTTGALLSTFKINIATRVKTIAATSSTVYVGGLFTAANGQTRNRLAAYAAANGALLGWDPNADDNVNTMVVSPDGSKVFVGGAFQKVGGLPAYGLAALDSSTGALLPWAVGNTVRNAGTNAAITSLSTDGTSIYGTGYVFGAGGNLEGTFSADPNAGAINWIEDCHGDTYGAYSNGRTVFTASHAHYCGNFGGFYQSDPWGTNMKHALAFTTGATGTIGHDPMGGSYFDWFGNPSPSMVNWFPTFTTGTFTGQDQAAWSVTGNGQYVIMAGEFPTVNGTAQQGLARFAVKPIAPAKRGPQATGSKMLPNLVQTSANQVKVTFPANWDQDDLTLTYKVVRDSNTTNPVQTMTADSTFWNRPNLGYVDTLPAGEPAGTTHRYRIYSIDSAGNQVAGDTATITTTAGPTPGEYAALVASQGAATYWRLDEPSGTSAVDTLGYNDALVSAGVTRATAGALNNDADTATTFNGTTTGLAATRQPIAAPDTFSTEAWVKTTTTTGGKIIGFGNLPVGNSAFYDRHVYMDNAGKIWFGVNNGAARTVNTTKSYNDGQWHQIVSTLGPDGMTLYVDGLRAAKRTDVTTGRSITGFWRVGGDNVSGWTSRPTSNYLNGSIDEVSIYPTALTKDQVLAQYIASGRTSPVPPAPADAYGAMVYNDQPDLYYRLGEASGTVATDTSASINPGSYFGTTTKGVAGAIDGVPDTAVTFNGTNGSAASNASFTNPTTYSEETWFKTNTTRGGKIIGFGSSASGLSASYDRHVYMQNDGKVVFGAYTGVQNVIVSPTGYNNNQWHHVVATQGSDGMKLYLDGQLIGSNTVTGAQNYTGFWRIGGDRTWNSTSSFFAGTIDEAAVYPTVLSAQRVNAHYRASGRTLANVLPTAAFTSTANGLNLSVDGTTSTDFEGPVASYAWNYGDGSAAGSGATATHTYAHAGDYQVTLTVTDADGGTNSVAHAVTVTNNAPVAAFTTAAADLVLSADASGSADPDGTVSSYSWDFGDSTPAETGATPTHTYASAGSYPVTLTVTDNDGGTSAKTAQVTLVGANVAPTAAFTSSPANLQVAFDGTGSTDPDGTIASHAWAFGGGATATGATPSYTFAASGSYPVTLTVTDNRGGTNSVTRTVTVLATNKLPTATFTSAVAGLTATVDASGSTDTDGTIASYAWTFGDSSTGTGATSSHTYAVAGTYPVALTVTDDRGGIATVTKSVTVVDPSTVATDVFARTIANAWGTSDFGGGWALQGSSALFSVNGSTAGIKMSAPGSGPLAYLNSVSAADLNGNVDIALDKAPTGSGVNNAVLVRHVGTSDYRVKLRIASTGASLQISKVVNNVETTLKTQTISGLSYTVGDTLRLSFQVKGTTGIPGSTTISAKGWKVGGTEPVAFQTTVNDTEGTLQAAGSVGVQAYLTSSATNAPVVASFDNLSLRAVPVP